MKKEQKFKRGNLVEVLGEGRKAIIEYSYAEEYGGSDVDSYSIIWQDTGSSLAWKRTDELKLIDEGGEYLFDEAKKNRERISEQNTDISYIVSKLDEGRLSSESILFLFDMFGHKTSFHRNGEFFILFSDWEQLHPVFLHIKNAETLEDAESIFTEEGRNKYNIKKVYDAFNGAAANVL